MPKVKEENVIFVKVSTFVGSGVGAVHYYGCLSQLIGGRSAEVTHKLSQIEADRLNAKWLTAAMRESPDSGYQKGECSSRFFSRQSVIVAAKKQFKKEFPKATVLVLGSSSYAEPQKILVGPKEFKTKINILAKAFAKLDWDVVADKKSCGHWKRNGTSCGLESMREMKTEYKHIHFEDISYMYPGRKTSVWLCSNSVGVVLGEIRWEPPWRQYCIFLGDQIVLAKSCCDDIGDFIGQLMAARNDKK